MTRTNCGARRWLRAEDPLECADPHAKTRHPSPPGALIAACAALAGCSFLGEQLAISSADGCIQRQCGAEQGKARQECTTLCQRQYGPK